MISISSIVNYIRRDLFLNQSKTLVSLAFFSLFFVVVSLLTLIGDLKMESSEISRVASVLLGLAGVIYASISFQELHKPERAYTGLTLPINVEERLLATLLKTSVMYIIIMTLLMQALSAVGVTIGALVFNGLWEFPTLFTQEYLDGIYLYLLWVPVYILGAIWFRSLHFIKTLFLLMAYFFVFAIIMGIFFFDMMIEFSGYGTEIFSNLPEKGKQVTDNLQIVMGIFSCPIPLIITYFRLKEKEI